ncbi:MAG: endonuclease MutS2, partial [Bacteroidales bacterium]|nr:endonuclease MutS2 [Bacteroidales bacterium]
MIYPDNFEQKIGFHEVRALLKGNCISILGKEMVDAINFSTDCDHINELMNQTREFRRLMAQNVEFPMKYFFDVREPLKRIHIVGTHLETEELFDLRRSMETINDIVAFFNKQDDDNEQPDFPSLKRLTDDIRIFPDIVRRIDQILDKFGRIKDSASSELQSIRRELTKTENSISRTLYNILHTAQSSGLVEKDVTPTLRDGRLVIPVAPALKRRISGIVHDESATGKTVYIEPTEVVEANNRIRELENEERREIIRILTELTNEIRPKAEDIIYSFHILSDIDFIHAKAMMAESMEAFEPTVEDTAQIDFIRAIHPLLRTSLERQGKQVVPLDITLHNEQRIIVISGPNAGGKSVCLKTVGLLQYMIQCGLPVSIGDRSSTGIFKDIMIDIGDEQSIEDDLSTYSSH